MKSGGTDFLAGMFVVAVIAVFAYAGIRRMNHTVLIRGKVFVPEPDLEEIFPAPSILDDDDDQQAD